MIIKVTQDRTASRATGLESEIGTDTYKLVNPETKEIKYGPLPDIAIGFIYKFDEGFSVQPFQFDLIQEL